MSKHAVLKENLSAEVLKFLQTASSTYGSACYNNADGHNLVFHFFVVILTRNNGTEPKKSARGITHKTSFNEFFRNGRYSSLGIGFTMRSTRQVKSS